MQKLTSKERAALRSMANSMDSIFRIGKNGITDEFVKQLGLAIKKRELIKFKLDKNSLLDIRETAEDIAEKLEAQVVHTMGNTVVLYKENPEYTESIFKRYEDEKE